MACTAMAYIVMDYVVTAYIVMTRGSALFMTGRDRVCVCVPTIGAALRPTIAEVCIYVFREYCQMLALRPNAVVGRADRAVPASLPI